MNDYKELIETLRNGTKSPLHVAPNGFMAFDVSVVNAIANVIEQLVKERDAAIADIEKYCRYCIVCKNADFTNDYTHNRCRKCLDEDNRYFEWRGVQEVEHEAD